MARIQIPIDILTSRLNLSDRFAGVRSQSLGTRFANLKPISEFLDLKRLSKPANFGEVQSRVNYNLGYFSSNYAVVFAMLSIYSLLTNWLLLFDIFFVVGGMWGIGKLEGRDLDIGVARATSSQLYTGFFRGGGLGGRPRSPKVVPSWGRPPGAKGSKRRRQWEREQAFWQEQARVEELDSDDTDTQGVGLNFKEKRFSSDPLQFTGIDLSSAPRSRKKYEYDDTESSEESSDESEEEGTSALQIALRDKEEALVQSALARIRRAQERGKREVKLNQEELDALQKRQKRMQSAATARKSGKGSGSASGSDRQRRSDRKLINLPIAGEPISRKSKSRKSEDRHSATAAPPGMLIAGPDGPAYAPLGYYPSQSGSSRDSPTRPRSATNRELRGTPPPQFAHQLSQSSRHFSDHARPASSSSNGARRPLPDDEDWVPSNSRRSSVSSQFNDPFQYQTSSGHPPPIPQQYMQTSSTGRRNVSGPAEVSYSTLRRSPPVAASYSSSARGPASDPSTARRRDVDDSDIRETSSEGDESDNLGNGAQVFVEVESEKERNVPSRKPVGSSKGRRKGKGR